MRIAVDYRSALREPTGVGRTVFHLLRALTQVGPLPGRGNEGASALDITAFTSSWKDRPSAADFAQLPGVRLVDRRLPVKVLNFLWHRLEWPPIELVAGRRFDIAYSPHPLLMPAREAAQVVMIHDLDFLLHPDRAGAEIRRDYRRLVREHAHRAAHVIVPSHYTARQVETELSLPADRMTVCYPGTPEWPMAAGPQHDRIRRHILFVGTLERRKNVGTLLDAYADLVSRRPDAPPLLLAGRARPEAAVWLDRIERPPLGGKVRHLGYVSDDQRRELFGSAALFVLPSFEEGFGMPALEAMSAGVPVVVSNRGALPEVVGEAGVIVEADDAEALAGAMERMLTDTAFADSSAAKGILRARRFQWTNTAVCALEAFERALQSRRP